MTILPDFKSSDERNKHIMNNADHWTAVRFQGRAKYEKYAEASQAEVEALAKRMANEKGGQWMIYAVLGPYDAYVKTITKDSK